MRFVKLATLAASLVMLLGASASAGQIASHIYIAQHMKQYMSDNCRAIVDANQAAYLEGAQGPDITGVVQYGLGRKSTMPVPTVGEESHYEKTGQLTLNIVLSAKKPAEVAFALGWITHYLNDQYVHPVVNRFGGYYKVDAKRHKALEQLESKYVYDEKADIVDKSTATSCPADLGKDFPGFLLQAYHWTFPDDELYQPNQTVGLTYVWDNTRLDHFCGQFQRAASWCLDAAKDFYEAHESGKGTHGMINTYVAGFPNMPTQAQFDRIMKPLIVFALASPQEINVSVTVQDNRLHGRFCKQWDEAMERCLDHGASVFPSVCAYVDSKDQNEKNQIREELKTLFPDVNLDQPLAGFDQSKIVPGNFKTEEVTWEYIPITESGSLSTDPKQVKTGKAKLENLKEDGWEGGKSGEASFKIAVAAQKQKFKLRVKLLPDAQYEGFDYVDYDSNTKEAQSLGPNEVMVGDIFEVRYELPPSIAADPRDRRYIVMADNASVTMEDSMSIQASLGNNKFRYDVACLEDKVEGGNLYAKLQVTDMNNDKLLGRQNLTVVRFDKGKANLDMSGLMAETNKMLEASSGAMDALDEAMNLSEEQEKELEAKMEAYEAELNKNPKLTDEEKEQAMAAKANELLKEMGIDITKLIESDKNVQDLDKMSEAPFSESLKMTFYPAQVEVTAAGGWATPAGYKPYGTGKYLTKSVSEKSESGISYLDVNGSFSISFTNDDEMKKSFQDRNKGTTAKVIPVEINGFKGVIYENTKIDEKSWQADNTNLPEGQEPDLSAGASFSGGVHGDGLLEKGKVLMQVSYGVDVKALMSTNKKGTVLYDGIKAGKTEYERGANAGIAMLRSTRLMPGPVTK